MPPSAPRAVKSIKASPGSWQSWCATVASALPPTTRPARPVACAIRLASAANRSTGQRREGAILPGELRPNNQTSVVRSECRQARHALRQIASARRGYQALTCHPVGFQKSCTARCGRTGSGSKCTYASARCWVAQVSGLSWSWSNHLRPSAPIAAAPLNPRPRQQPGRGKGVGETETQIPRPLEPAAVLPGLPGQHALAQGEEPLGCGNTHTVIDEMAKLYRRHPGHTRHGDLCCRISLAQVVKEMDRRGSALLSSLGAYHDSCGHNASLTQPVCAAGARHRWSGMFVGTCRSLGTKGRSAWTAANTVSAVSVRRQAMFNGGPQTFFHTADRGDRRVRRGAAAQVGSS